MRFGFNATNMWHQVWEQNQREVMVGFRPGGALGFKLEDSSFESAGPALFASGSVQSPETPGLGFRGLGFRVWGFRV